MDHGLRISNALVTLRSVRLAPIPHVPLGCVTVVCWPSFAVVLSPGAALQCDRVDRRALNVLGLDLVVLVNERGMKMMMLKVGTMMYHPETTILLRSHPPPQTLETASEFARLHQILQVLLPLFFEGGADHAVGYPGASTIDTQ